MIKEDVDGQFYHAYLDEMEAIEKKHQDDYNEKMDELLANMHARVKDLSQHYRDIHEDEHFITDNKVSHYVLQQTIKLR